MPISRWICNGCGGREVPLSHFSDTACGELVHPDYAAAILKDRSEQYISHAVRVSHGLGCPRRAAIEESVDFAVDPLSQNAMLTGTAWHALVEAAGPNALVEVEVEGVVADVKVRGKMDRLRKLHNGDWAVEDWKHVGEFGLKYVKPGPKPEHIVQTSIYAELVAQVNRPRPTVGLIWYHSSSGGKDAMVPHKFPLMPLHEAVNHRPYDCDFTVGELLRQAASHYENGVKWEELPLAGASIKFGAKTGCDYCGVRSICKEAEVGTPF